MTATEQAGHADQDLDCSGTGNNDTGDGLGAAQEEATALKTVDEDPDNIKEAAFEHTVEEPARLAGSSSARDEACAAAVRRQRCGEG